MFYVMKSVKRYKGEKWLVLFFLTFIELSTQSIMQHLLRSSLLYGVRAKELDWFKSYLFNWKQLVEIDGVRSNEEPVTSGVPQGSILGPLIFLLLFDTIADCLHHSQIIMYADDTVLYFSDKDVNKINNCINKDMELISNYCYHNKLILNVKKGKTELELISDSRET